MFLPILTDAVSNNGLHTVAERILNEKVKGAVALGGGRNSRVYRLILADGRSFALKVYFRHTADDRDRLGTEFHSLRFLWSNGLRSIPEPIRFSHNEGLAVYEYIRGDNATVMETSAQDIDSALRMLACLNHMKDKPGAMALPSASEACFSVEDIVANIQHRLYRLLQTDDDSQDAPGLHPFLHTDLIPGFEAAVSWARKKLANAKEFFRTIPRQESILSPSDFGFHNAIRKTDGRLTFLDFEYFGWDDPAKTAVDFILHPAMNLSTSLKKRFVQGVITRFDAINNLDRRIQAVYPLFGIKWCLIMLNEFLPESLLRRRFAVCGTDDGMINHRQVQAEQLAKARQLWKRVRNEYERFPYTR